MTVPLVALSTEETPLFDPYISGRNVGLGNQGEYQQQTIII